MKCANCQSDALFDYKITLNTSIYYCNTHLPKFLEARKMANSLAITPKFEEAKQEAIDKLTPEVTPEEDTEKKKPAKKKAE